MRLGVITDVHLAPADTPPVGWHNPYPMEQASRLLHDAVERCLFEEVDGIVLLGDVAHLGDEPSLAAALTVAAGTGISTWIVAGNHDVEMGAGTLAATASPFPTITVAPWRAASVEGVRLVGIALADAQTALVEPIADDGVPTLLLTHYPVLTLRHRLTVAALLDAGDLSNVESLQAVVMERSGPTVVLHGHQHVRASAVSGPVLQLSGAALIEPPHDVAILDVERHGGTLAVGRRCLAVAPSGSARLPVLDPHDGHWTWNGNHWHPTCGHD